MPSAQRKRRFKCDPLVRGHHHLNVVCVDMLIAVPNPDHFALIRETRFLPPDLALSPVRSGHTGPAGANRRSLDPRAMRTPIDDPVADDRPRIVTARIIDPVVIDLAQVDARAGVKPISLQS